MKISGRLLKIVLLLALCFSITSYLGFACSPGGFQGSPPTATPKSENPPESAYCSGLQNYPGGLTVTGLAQFHARVNLANACTLGSADPTHATRPAAVRPIRFAEVQVLDESSQIIQCGETDTNGNFSVVVPRNRSLTVKINSRSLNAHVQASVLDTPTTNTVYSITAAVNSGPGAEPRNIGSIIAPATTADLRGGAFNILNNILRENEALRFHTCGAIQKPYADSSCFTFSSTDPDVAPRVVAYWAKGVNPYVYFGGDAGSGISFYVPGTDKLYILGGINGDVDSSDTDHFDDAVISHEYGHFLEDHYAKTNSPGGSHDGNRILDARLVWSEGWANFISSATRTDKYYRDSSGNIDGTAGCFFNYDLDKNFNSTTGGPLDTPTANREGNFHEFAIARALWDVIDVVPVPTGQPAPPTGYTGANGTAADDNSGDSTTESLGTLWNGFKALADSSLHFRSMGLYLSPPRLPASIGISGAVTFHKMQADITDYGKPLPTSTGVGCTNTTYISITPNDPKPAGGSVLFGGSTVCSVGSHHTWCSNQFASNDFYAINHDGTISSITLTRTSGTADIDLYLYKENYTFERTDTDVLTSNTDPMPASSPPNASKTINLSGVPHGIYMLNVSAFEANQPATSQYQLFVNGGVQVCP